MGFLDGADIARSYVDLLQQLAETNTRFVIRVSYPNRVVKDTEALRTNTLEYAQISGAEYGMFAMPARRARSS